MLAYLQTVLENDGIAVNAAKSDSQNYGYSFTGR